MLQLSYPIDYLSLSVFGMVINTWARMVIQELRNETLQRGPKCFTLGILTKAKRNLRVDYAPKAPLTLTGRFEELKGNEVSVVTISAPQLRKDYDIRFDTNSLFFMSFLRDVVSIYLERVVFYGGYGHDSDQKNNGKEMVATSEVAFQASQLPDATIQNFGSETQGPLYVLPDCSVFWKSEQDIDLSTLEDPPLDGVLAEIQKPRVTIQEVGFPPLWEGSHVWKSIQDEAFVDLWQCCLYTDLQETSGEPEDRWNLEAGEKDVKEWQDWEPDSGYGDYEGHFEDLPVPTEKVCGLCLVPVEMSKFHDQRRYGLLNNCNHVFCYPCLLQFCNPTSNPFVKTASCPECGVVSEAVATSLVWKEGLEKHQFFSDFLFDACISPQSSPQKSSMGMFLLDQIEKVEKDTVESVHDYGIAAF